MIFFDLKKTKINLLLYLRSLYFILINKQSNKIFYICLEPTTVESSTTTNSSGGEKMQKLFKKKAALFWTTNHQTNSNSNSSALKSSQQNININNNNNIESSSTTINQQNKVNSLSTQHINKIETHKKNSFERDLYRLHHHPNSMLTHANRSNSLHYVSGLQQNAATPNPAASTTTTLSYRASSKPPTSESNTTSNKPSSLPFYNRLKKVHHSHAPHLFGSRLEKICGPFHPETNCRLPSSIMVCETRLI